jgi:hypothetical protein
MKLSIVPVDKTVCKDGVCYINVVWEGTPDNVHALQWQDTQGWIEYTDGTINENITVLPDWAQNALAVWEEAAAPKPHVPYTAEENKIIARSRLEVTDWTTIPDVGDPTKSNPYLANQAEFVTYRNTIRQIAINPIDGDIDFPDAPNAQWASV